MQTLILTVTMYSVSDFLEALELTFWRLWNWHSGDFRIDIPETFELTFWSLSNWHSGDFQIDILETFKLKFWRLSNWHSGDFWIDILETLEFCIWVMLQDLCQCFCVKVSFLQHYCWERLFTHPMKLQYQFAHTLFMFITLVRISVTVFLFLLSSTVFHGVNLW